VVEATGSERGIARALELTLPRGKVILKTTVAAAAQVNWSPIVIHELSVVGSRCGDLARALGLLESGRLDPEPLLAATYPLHRADAALEHAAHRGTLKVLVER
jgi:threonine dehydrogenase-like Zn-dependent dehydrogenase